MNMKVLERNKSFGVFPMLVICQRVADKYGFSYGKENDFCGSKLEIEAEDIKSHDWDKYPDYHGTDYGVICPVCGQFVVIDEKLLPVSVMEKASKFRFSELRTGNENS